MRSGRDRGRRRRWHGGIRRSGRNSFSAGCRVRYDGTCWIVGNVSDFRVIRGRCVVEASAGSSASSQRKRTRPSSVFGAITLMRPGGGKRAKCRRIDNLEDIKTEGMQRRGGAAENRRSPVSGGAGVPSEDKPPIALGGQLCAQFGGAVASATEEIPCSSARFVTSITRS